MSRARIAVGVLAVVVMSLDPGAALGQDYPNKPIRLVTTTTGSTSELIARLIGPGIATPLGQPVIVENRGAGVIPTEAVVKAPADGHILLVQTSAVWISPFFEKVPYDPVRDLAPVASLAKAPAILVVHPALPVKSVKDLISLAKARPGALSNSAGANGSIPHLAGELFKSMAGINIVRIPYANNATERADQISGEVQLSFGSPGNIGGLVKAGRLRALAVTTPQPSALFPELPPMAATLPGYDVSSIYAMWAPAKTPDPVVKRVSLETARFLSRPEVKEKLLSSGLEAVGSSPEELAAVIKADMVRLGKLFKEAGLR